MRTEERKVPSEGAELHLYVWAPEGAARGSVQIVHGMAEHAARYARLAEALTGAGWAVYAHDQRGHGKTAAREEDVGHFADRDGWRKVIDDARLVRRLAQSEIKGPLVLLGHSMGSFVSLHDVTGQPGSADALVLSGSNKGGGALVRAGRMAAYLERARQGARGKSGLLASLSFGSFNKPFEPARTEFDWLSRDPAEVDRYVADPRCGFRCTNQLWIDFTGALVDLGSATRLARLGPVPTYVISGAADPVGDAGKGVLALVAQLREAGAKVDHRLYEGARHELFNETHRDEVTRELLAWLDETLPRS